MSTFLERARVAATIYGLACDSVAVLTDDGDMSFTNISDSTLIAIMVASTSASNLMQHAQIGDDDDAFARAAKWAAKMSAQPRTTPTSPARIREIVTLATSHRRVLVEPDLPTVMRGVRSSRLPVERAITSLILRGATAWPLLFVHETRAPKNGLAKLREERILDASFTCIDPDAMPSALEPLRDAQMTGKQLLRELRAKQSASANDGLTLAKTLTRLWLDGIVDASM